MFEDVKPNPVFGTDGYNLFHHKLKKDTKWEVSHIYNRAEPIFIYGLNHVAVHAFDTKITENMVNDAWEASEKYLGNKKIFPINMWNSIVKDFKGYVPLRIQCMPDGMWSPARTPLAQIRNTEEGFGEMVTWAEGKLLKFAFSSGCLTRAYKIWQYIKDRGLPENRSHSFAYRSYDNDESAKWGGTAWAIFLKGSDDFDVLRYVPNAGIKSIIASAHKVEQQFNNEMDGYIQAVDSTVEVGERIFSMMIDTYDASKFIETYMKELLNYAKNKGVHVVLRPDSGDVLQQAITIYKKAVVDLGFNNVNVIIGEGMSHQKVIDYDKELINNGVPLGFVFYGIGGGYHADITRDHPSGASMKTSYSNGEPRMKIVKGYPFKESIPDIVSIIANSNAELVVDNTDIGGLYMDAYNFDSTMNEPKTTIQSWDDVNERVWEQINNGYVKQEKILLSNGLQTSINEFKARYT